MPALSLVLFLVATIGAGVEAQLSSFVMLNALHLDPTVALSGHFPGEWGLFDDCLALSDHHHCMVDVVLSPPPPAGQCLLSQPPHGGGISGGGALTVPTGVCVPRNVTAAMLQRDLCAVVADVVAGGAESAAADSGGWAAATAPIRRLILGRSHALSFAFPSSHVSHYYPVRVGTTVQWANASTQSTQSTPTDSDPSPLSVWVECRSTAWGVAYRSDSVHNGTASAVDNEAQWSRGARATVGCLVVLAVLAVAGTAFVRLRPSHRALDTDEGRGGNLAGRLLASFDLGLHWRQLVRPTPAFRGVNLRALNGIRMFSITWVVLGHTWTYFIAAPNSLTVAQAASKWPFQVLPAAEFAVDSFFLMSGLLMAFLTARHIDRVMRKRADRSYGQGPRWWPLPINVPLLIVHRVWRLWPVMALSQLLTAWIVPLVVSGPNARSVESLSSVCQDPKRFWANLLFVSNFWGNGATDMCNGVQWYLDVDMQLFLITPLFLLAYAYNRRIGWAMLLTALAATVAASIGLAFHYDLKLIGLLPQGPHVLYNWFQNFYVKPWVRAPPYFIGLALGWLLFERSTAPPPSTSYADDNRQSHARSMEYSSLLQRPAVNDLDEQPLLSHPDDHLAKAGGSTSDFRHSFGSDAKKTSTSAATNMPLDKMPPPRGFPMWALVLGWALCCSAMLYLAFAPTQVFHDQALKGEQGWSATHQTMYMGYSRAAWGLALGWLVFACAIGQGGPINWLLSLPMWTVLAKLVFGVYLLHYSVLGVIVASGRQPELFSGSNVASLYIFVSLITYALAVVSWLVVEGPLAELEKQLIGKVR